MRRRVTITVLMFPTIVAVLSCPFSVGQQGEPEAERKILSKVAPAYPQLARKMNVCGVVKLLIVIEPDGKVKSTEVIGGNPVLVQAAVEAVRQWRYEPAPQPTHRLIELRFDAH
jgi:TonB family protein